MPIEGTLKTFDVPTILQIIHSSGKSGILVVKRDRDERVVMFGIKEGTVYAALEKIKGKQRGIIDYLYEYGYINKDQLKEIKEKAETLKKKPEEILFIEKYVTEEELKKCIESKILELMTAIIKWGQDGEDGSYHFEEDLTMNYHKGKMQIAIDLGYAVFDSARRVDEIKKIEDEIPSYDIVPVKTKEDISDDEEMDEYTKEFFNLIDGKKTILQISKMVHVGSYKSLEIVHALLNAGYIELKKEEGEYEEEEKEKINLTPYLIKGGVVLFLIINIIVSLVILKRPVKFINNLEVFKYRVPYQMVEENIRIYLKEYYLVHGKYPAYLPSYYSKDYEYKSDGESFTLKYIGGK